MGRSGETAFDLRGRGHAAPWGAQRPRRSDSGDSGAAGTGLLPRRAGQRQGQTPAWSRRGARLGLDPQPPDGRQLGPGRPRRPWGARVLGPPSCVRPGFSRCPRRAFALCLHGPESLSPGHLHAGGPQGRAASSGTPADGCGHPFLRAAPPRILSPIPPGRGTSRLTRRPQGGLDQLGSRRTRRVDSEWHTCWALPGQLVALLPLVTSPHGRLLGGALLGPQPPTP